MPRDLSTWMRRGSTLGGKSAKDPSLEGVTFHAVTRSASSGAVLIWERSWLRFMVGIEVFRTNVQYNMG